MNDPAEILVLVALTSEERDALARALGDAQANAAWPERALAIQALQSKVLAAPTALAMAPARVSTVRVDTEAEGCEPRASWLTSPVSRVPPRTTLHIATETSSGLRFTFAGFPPAPFFQAFTDTPPRGVRVFVALA